MTCESPGMNYIMELISLIFVRVLRQMPLHFSNFRTFLKLFLCRECSLPCHYLKSFFPYKEPKFSLHLDAYPLCSAHHCSQLFLAPLTFVGFFGIVSL